MHTKKHHLNLNSTFCARPRYLPSSSRWLESRSRVPWTLEAELSEAALFADLSSSRSVLPSAMVEAQASKNRIFLWNWLDSPCFESSWDNNHCCVTLWQKWANSRDITLDITFFLQRPIMSEQWTCLLCVVLKNDKGVSCLETCMDYFGRFLFCASKKKLWEKFQFFYEVSR